MAISAYAGERNGMISISCTALMTPVAGYTAKTKGKDEQIKKIDYPPYFTAGQRRHIAFCPESEETTERTKTLLSGNIIDTDPGKIFDSLFTASNTTSHSGSKADGDGKEQAEDGEEEEDYDKRTKQKKNGAKNLNELYAVALNNDPEQVFASGLTVGDTACDVRRLGDLPIPSDRHYRVEDVIPIPEERRGIIRDGQTYPFFPKTIFQKQMVIQ